MANRDEVEEFLRRAAARRAAAQQPQKPPAQPQGWPSPPPPQQLQPQQPYAQQPQRRPASLAEVVILEPVPTLQPVEAEVVDAELAEQPDRLGKYVARDLRGPRRLPNTRGIWAKRSIRRTTSWKPTCTRCLTIRWANSRSRQSTQ